MPVNNWLAALFMFTVLVFFIVKSTPLKVIWGSSAVLWACYTGWVIKDLHLLSFLIVYIWALILILALSLIGLVVYLSMFGPVPEYQKFYQFLKYVSLTLSFLLLIMAALTTSSLLSLEEAGPAVFSKLETAKSYEYSAGSTFTETAVINPFPSNPSGLGLNKVGGVVHSSSWPLSSENSLCPDYLIYQNAPGGVVPQEVTVLSKFMSPSDLSEVDVVRGHLKKGLSGFHPEDYKARYAFLVDYQETYLMYAPGNKVEKSRGIFLEAMRPLVSSPAKTEVLLGEESKALTQSWSSSSFTSADSPVPSKTSSISTQTDSVFDKKVSSVATQTDPVLSSSNAISTQTESSA